MTSLSTLKFRTIVNFPAQTFGRTGITVTKTSPNFYIDLDYSKFGSSVIPTDPVNQNFLLWNSLTSSYSLVALQNMLSSQTLLGPITINGNLIVTGGITSTSPTAGIGYAGGAGGVVTQITSRTTAVILNKICGAITLFAAAPVLNAWVSFTVTNSTVAATDIPMVAVKSGTNTYVAEVSAVGTGSFQVSFSSILGTASDSPVINFVIIKAVAG